MLDRIDPFALAVGRSWPPNEICVSAATFPACGGSTADRGTHPAQAVSGATCRKIYRVSKDIAANCGRFETVNMHRTHGDHHRAPGAGLGRRVPDSKARN